VQFSHGGVCYEVVDAKRIGIAVVLTNIQAFVKLAGDVKALIIDGALESSVRHEVYGIVFFEDEHSDMNHLDDVLRERRITVFADGQVDRLPCGSGICARLAIHYMDRRIRPEHGSFSMVLSSVHSSKGMLCEKTLLPANTKVAYRE
jgi:proline racemase